jgi:hypothetical protein
MEATKRAVKDVFEQEADDYFVLVVSDANLSRYGVDPIQFGALLTSNVAVNAFALFIASFDNEAFELKKKMPVGKGFVIFDTGAMPNTFKQIFASSSFLSDRD